MTSVIQDGIIIMLDENGDEIKGTEKLALMLSTTKSYVVKCARIVQSKGLIKIIQARGGRGNRTVYKRNRNQPGLPRKR